MDSKCLYDTMIKLSTVSEKSLLIEISENMYLTNIAHAASKYNLGLAYINFSNSYFVGLRFYGQLRSKNK